MAWLQEGRRYKVSWQQEAPGYFIGTFLRHSLDEEGVPWSAEFDVGAVEDLWAYDFELLP